MTTYRVMPSATAVVTARVTKAPKMTIPFIVVPDAPIPPETGQRWPPAPTWEPAR